MAFETVPNIQDCLLTINTKIEPAVRNVLPGVHVHPLFIDKENGTWVLYVQFEPGTILPKHFHTGVVHFYTTGGTWNYSEYPDDEQTAGSYLYEPGGSIHTFEVPADATEPAQGFMVVQGANINFAENDAFLNIMDAGWIEQAILAACHKASLPPPRYIRPAGKAGFSA